MTTKTIPNDQIRSEIFKILSGYWQRLRETPKIYILSPWISDVQLETDADVLKLDELWFGLDYGIFSINLAYAILLVKLVFGTEINIVTRDPAIEEKFRGKEYAQTAYNLLDFLDEIGCRVFLNSSLLSTLILCNDVALAGSFDLSKPVYGEEEIGTSLNDPDDMKILEKRALDTIDSSTPYGYTVHVAHTGSSIVAKATRGWLFEMIAEHYFPKASLSKRDCSNIFLTEHIGTKSVYLNGMVKEVAPDLDTFYIKAILQALMDGEARSIERNFRFLSTLLDYKGHMEISEVMNFLEAKFAREHVPKIPLRILSMPEYSKNP
jgi:hypothetical protein